MNRRQDIAVWATGLLLAGISAYCGNRDENWLFELFVPVLIVGVMVVHSLRSRGRENVTLSDVLKGGVGLLLAVSLVGHLQGRVDALDGDVSSATAKAEEAAEEAGRAMSEADEVKSEVSDLERKVGDIETEALDR